TADGVATLTYEALWRKGNAFFPFDGVDVIRLYDPANVSRTSPLRTVFASIGNTTVFRDVSDPAFDFRIQVITIDLAGLGLPQGSYVARFDDCCRIRGIQNAPESTYALETLIIYDGTDNGSPILNSRILTVVGKGLPYDQNLNAFDPDGRPLTYQWLIGSGHPTRGPTFNVPGITLDGAGQIFISPFDTANLVDFNPFNPAGDYVFKVRVTDADGAFSDRDVLLDVVATANQPPQIAPIGNRVIEVGESLVLPITAADPNAVDTVTLDTSVLPDNTVLVRTPGNPASGTLAFRPDAGQVGVFGINVEAEDDGTPILTDSELVTITVLDPGNGCPVLSALGNFDLMPGETLSFALSGADPDAGQMLSFAGSFLPPGASFDPATATFSWTPTAADVGVHLGTVFEIRDNSVPPCADREAVGFSVQPSNRFPELDPIGERSVTESAMVFFTVSASDPDGDALTFSAQPLPIGASFDPATRELMWTPTIGQAGTYEVTFRATDAGTPSLSDSETVRITVAPDGSEAIRLIGVAEEQVVAGPILVEAQVVSPFEITSVAFAIDGVEVNADAAAPYFLGGEQDGMPLGFDTSTLADGLHVIEATALDSAGQTNTTQRKIVVRNFVPPVVDDVDGLFDGAVTAGTIEVEIEASDDQQVASVEFLIDGESVNTETGVRYFLGGGLLPAGTFDVSCTVCLEAGDQDDDLVVVAVDEDGTLAVLCAAGNLTGIAFKGDGNGTPDGDPPADEDVCDVFRGVNGPAFGLCNAFCEAQDCDGPGFRETPCEQLRQNFIEQTGENRFPCEGGGDCIQALTLGWVEDPSRLATFGPEDFNGVLTRFQLPFEVPLGFDTTTLDNGAHTLTVIVTDNTGLETTVEIDFVVDNAPPPPDALKVTIAEPTTGEVFEAGRVLPFAAAIADAQGPVTVRFYADSDLVIEDQQAPFGTAVLVPDGTSSLVLQAIAEDDRGPRAAVPVVLAVMPRPVEEPEVEVLAISLENDLDGVAPLSTRLRITLSQDVDPASLTDAVSLDGGGTPLAVDVFVGADPQTVIAEPLVSLEPDTLHTVVVDGLSSLDGGRAPRRTARFLTEAGVATVLGFIADSDFEPLAGMAVSVGGVDGVTDEEGVFRLTDVPQGPQFLDVAGGLFDGVTYPALDFAIEVASGLDESGLDKPIVLPSLDVGGGLEVIAGTADGSGILTSSQLPGMALDLTGVTVENPDGTPFTGRMSISLVPDDAVPMELPPGVSSPTVVTVQPPSLRFDPPAPITYPALDSALPGETLPLWHFDHDLGDWFEYGTGTVTADGASIVSNPGQGLPKTGWGSPQPPWTTTTVTGRVFDSDPQSPPDGNDLHGCRVTAGTRFDFSDRNGLFRIENVGAGRQGRPIDIRVTAVCHDIRGRWYLGRKTVRAVQDGITQVSKLRIPGYAPLINNRLILHGDFQNRRAEKHVLQLNSSHAGEQRYQSEVNALRKLLRQRGFRQGGDIFNRGMLLTATGSFDADVRRAVLLFNTLEFENGGATGALGNDDKVGPGTSRRLNEAPPLLWGNMAQFGGIDYGCSDLNRAEPGDGYGATDAGIFLQRTLAMAINDISPPSGGPMPKHGSHQTGIDIDISLPNTN
ncbi:MAG: putative Ig domain-containing protein, partial [Thermoanaerobaculia bacterium]